MSRAIIAALLLTALANPAAAQAPKAGASPVKVKARVDALGDPLPAGAVARFGSVRLQHAGDVLLAFTADSRRIISVGTDKAFQIWAADSGKELRRYQNADLTFYGAGAAMMINHGGRIVMYRGGQNGQAPLTLAFSPDGRWVATLLDTNKTAVIWDTSTGEEARRFPFEYDAGHALALSTDGKLFAGGDFGENPHIRVWDRAGGKEIRRLKALNPVSILRFSHDNHYLAGIENNQVRVWDVTSGKRVRTYQGLAQAITGMAFSPDGKLLAAAAQDGIRIWETASEEEVGKLPPGDIGFTGLVFSPDGRSLATTSFNGMVQIWDIATATVRRSFQGYVPTVGSMSWALAWSPDGCTLAMSCGGAIHLWDPGTGKEKALPRLPGAIQRAAFLPGRGVVLTTDKGAAFVGDWDRGTLKPRPAKGEIKGTLWGVSPDGKLQMWSDESEQFVLWHAAEGRAVLTVKPPTAAAAFSADGQLVAVAAGDGSVGVWRTDTAREVRRFTRAGMVAHIAFSPDGRTLATVDGQKGEICLWEFNTGRVRARCPCPSGTLTSLAFSADGQFLAGGGSDEVIRVWDGLSGRLLRGLVGHRGPVLTVDFAPRGPRLVSGGDDGTVRVWDVRSGEEQRRLKGHRAGVQAVAFAPDGRHVVSAGRDATALVWDLQTPGAAPPQARVRDQALQQLWLALGHEDAEVAYRAIGDLLVRRQEVVPLLREHLQPVPRVKADRLATLLASLNHGRYAAREKAMRDLEKLEGQALAALRHAQAHNPTPEATKRMGALLSRLEAPLTDPQSLRALRAVVLLERLGTAEARDLLHTLAEGAPGARLTSDAREAWQRLSRRGQSELPQSTRKGE